MISPINGHDRLATYDTAERVRGTTDFDGLERITSASPMDLLEIEQRDRKAGAYRRLARVMTELGWATVRVRDFTRGGYKEQVRGYVRSVPPGSCASQQSRRANRKVKRWLSTSGAD